MDQKIKIRTSTKFIIITATITTMLSILMVTLTHNVYVDKIIAANTNIKVETNSIWYVGEILRLNESLTMMSRLSILSQDNDWNKKYDEQFEVFQNVLLELKNIDSQIFNANGGEDAITISHELHQIIEQSMMLENTGKHGKAYQLLTDKKFNSLKEQFSDSMFKLLVVFQNKLEKDNELLQEKSRSLLRWVYIATGLFILSVLVASVIAIVLIEKNELINEQNSVKSNQMILAGEMASLINHEFKNILFILTFPIENLKKHIGENANEKIIRSIEKIQINFSRFESIITAFGSLVRPTDLKITLLSVEDALKDVIYFAEMLSQKRGIRFAVNYKTENPKLVFRGNQILFTQVLINLIKNSCDAIESFPIEKRWVNLEISESNGNIMFHVIDSGAGLSGVVKEKILHERVSTKGLKGTGLGMSISKQFTELQGGTLKYEENKENTTFTVTLKAG